MFRKISVVVVSAAAALASTIGIAATPASAAPITGYYYGNYFFNYSNAIYVDNVGPAAEASVGRDRISATSIDYTPIAYDLKADGLSAKSVVTFQQLRSGVWVNSSQATVIASMGYKYSYVGAQRHILKAADATRYRFLLTVCSYDSPTGVSSNCVNRPPTSGALW